MSFVPLLRRTVAIGLIASLSALAARAETASGSPGATQVLKWKDGKKACFVLAFDDSAPSQLANVIPELEKRKIVGTFYLVTGNSLYANLKAKWEAAAKSPYVVVANHTFTHRGVTTPEELEPELAKCNEVLYALHPERKVPRLLAFGQPGGVPWVVTKEEQQAALDKNFLINRPSFAGPPIHYKSAEQVVAVVDQALTKGEMGHLDFHGVGGDWLVTPMEWFTALLDKLDASKDQLWVTDTASYLKYAKERDGAEVKVLEAGNDRIRLALVTKTDAALYDEPLTLSTKVPAGWANCVVVQGQTKTTSSAHDGSVQFTAVPGTDEITIQPAR